MLEPPSPSVCLNCLSHPGLLGGGGWARWGGGASGAPAKKHLLLSPPRGHTQAQHRPLPGHWLAPGSLTSASGRCRVSAANTQARAPTGARVHPRGYTPLPSQAGQVSRGHQQVGEVPSSGFRGPLTRPLRAPGYRCPRLIPKLGSSGFQPDRLASRALALLVTASPAPTVVSGTKQAQ